MITELSAAQVKRFDRWESAKAFLFALEGPFVFRGMGSAEWDLETSLERCARYHYAQAEKILTESFKRALPRFNNPPPGDDPASWLALMRHYGLPSRLLDFTESCLVAAFFAADSKPEPEFAIWAFQTNAVQRSAEESLGILNSTSRSCSPLELGTDTVFTAAFQNTKCFVALVDTNHKTERQLAQRGLFMCPGNSEWPFWKNLMGAHSARGDGALYQVILPCDARKDVTADLLNRNINHAELLPDPHHLEMLCDELKRLLEESQSEYGHFQWKLEVVPEFERRGLKVEITEAGRAS